MDAVRSSTAFEVLDTRRLQENIEIRPVPAYLRLVDYLLFPLMALLSGFNLDSVQETHTYHTQPVNPRLIDDSLALEVPGANASRFKNHGRITSHFGLFHVPILGGWRDYIVLEASSTGPWHVGWKLCDQYSGDILLCEVHRLPISDAQIKVLESPSGTILYLFACTPDGVQIPIRLVGEGTIGDRKYPGIRLF
jgi:hypothetical protein